MPTDGIELTRKSTAGGATDDTVTLPWALRQKSRQRLRLDDGREAALVLAPGTFLDDGDRLESAGGFSVRVCAAREPVSVGRTTDPLRLARACYHLGNRHVALQVGDGWVRYLPDHVLDEMVRGLGLTVAAAHERFEPERGAYAHAHASGHGDGHDHASGIRLVAAARDDRGHHHPDGAESAAAGAHAHHHGHAHDDRHPHGHHDDAHEAGHAHRRDDGDAHDRASTTAPRRGHP